MGKVDVSKIPSGLVEGWDGLVFSYKTSLATENLTAEEHERLVKPIIDKQMNDSYDHGQEWRLVKVEAVIWKEYHQVSLAKFRIRDSY